MKKAILISIKPKYVTDILNREKVIEIRKNIPSIIQGYYATYGNEPITVYIYCSKRPRVKDEFNNPMYNGTVVGKFQLQKYEAIKCEDNQYFTMQLPPNELLRCGCLDYDKLNKYLKGRDGFAWCIDNLEVFKTPRELGEFRQPRGARGKVDFDTEDYHIEPVYRAPQSWCYVIAED